MPRSQAESVNGALRVHAGSSERNSPNLAVGLNCGTGILYQTLPMPSPLSALPVGISNIVNVPICGTCLLSLIQAIFAPNSMSVSPNSAGPTPLDAYLGLFSGATNQDGSIAWSCTRGNAPQLNSKAGPTESIFHRCSVRAGKYVELIVVQVDWSGSSVWYAGPCAHALRAPRMTMTRRAVTVIDARACLEAGAFA